MTGEEWGKITPNLKIYYSLKTNSQLYEGDRGGYYGKKEVIEDDLRGMGALALTSPDLPKEIDVQKTIEGLAKCFLENSFEPPKLIVPSEVEKRFAPPIARLCHRIKK